MGKYMRKRTGRAPAAEFAQVVAGVRTRSRTAAAFASAAAAAPAPKRPRKLAPPRAEVEVETGLGDGGCAAAEAEAGCYLQLRSRRLFMAAAAEVRTVRCPLPAKEKAALPLVARSGASGEPVLLVAGISRCSSTASSVDVIVAAATARETSGSVAEAREDRGVESAVSDSAGCGRVRREATPSSRPPADLSDEESSQAADGARHQRRRMPLTAGTAAEACKARMPAEEEIEEFFAAAEKAEAERFAAKYNFDVARGLPLDAGGRFEWTTVASG